jgi:zinc protease
MKVLLTFMAISMALVMQSYSQINITYDQYTLKNGLTVIIHEDHNAPVAAVTVLYHVGSKNEQPRRTGFAHLFEHMMFQGSAHVGDNEHFKFLQEVGANVNGFTNQDGTTYFEVVPSNFVELALYLESDRMGFLLGTMTQDKLDNQRDVVKNERRQNYDNRPYGTANEKILRALYPTSHPYSWPVIGYMEDLSAASLDDVKNFFRTYYAPNNACLVVSGDIQPYDVKPLVEKYFGSITRGKTFERPKPAPMKTMKQERMMYEDKVQLPRLYMDWHTVPGHSRENAVLDVLGSILSRGKNSRLYKSLVYEKQIAQSAFASQDGSEIAGTFETQVTAKPGKTLTEMEQNVNEILNTVLKEGVTQNEIDKEVISQEVQVINRAATVLGKANSLASFYSYTGNPGNINTEIEFYRGITPQEVLIVAKKYLNKDAAVVLSVVPEGKSELGAKKGE